MLEGHVEMLEEKQENIRKKFKHDGNLYDKRNIEIDRENKVMEIKLKEKDQEIKLHDLKVRELKKVIPHTRLRPLKGRHKTVDHTNDE